MALEQSLTRLFVHIERVRGGNRLESVGVHVFPGVGNRPQEEVLIPAQRELIHGVDNWQVEQHKVQCGGLLANGAIVLTILKELLQCVSVVLL